MKNITVGHFECWLYDMQYYVFLWVKPVDKSEKSIAYLMRGASDSSQRIHSELPDEGGTFHEHLVWNKHFN